MPASTCVPGDNVYDTIPSILPSSSEMYGESLPTIFALVIGINEYRSKQALGQAVSDADKFQDYLLNNLRVPPSNIRNLRDEDATRDNIIKAFSALQNDLDIIKDKAAIIIFFAGHGSRVKKPEEWVDWASSSGHIEILCPSDMTTEGKGVPGIPDRTIAVLLNNISYHKGNNITLILDCCHSGGLNRRDPVFEPTENGYFARYFHNAPPIPSDCDAEILSKAIRGAGVAAGFSGMHRASHILLAACGSNQSAWENSDGGAFTASLLKALSYNHVDDLTYTTLMHRLPISRIDQTPHCEGQYVNRRLFNHRVAGTDGSFILGELGSDGCYTLCAGAAQGITEGSLFDVHNSDLIPNAKQPNSPLAECVVSSVQAFKSTLTLSPSSSSFIFPPLFYCTLIRPGDQMLNIYCEDKQWLESTFPPDIRERLSVSFADSAAASSLQFHLSDGQVSIARNDPLVTPWTGPNLSHKIDQDKVAHLREIVRRIIHFDHHLKRTSPHTFNKAPMELTRLEYKPSAGYNNILRPVGPNLIDHEPADIAIKGHHYPLGMTIRNPTDIPLYPHLFYFDPTNFEITNWYTPPFGAGKGRSTTAVDAPLPPNGTLTVGYGNGGANPWYIWPPDKGEFDIGFFKLFLTGSPADFSSIPQDSAFKEAPLRKDLLEDPTTELWGTILSTVRQSKDTRKLSLLNAVVRGFNDI